MALKRADLGKVRLIEVRQLGRHLVATDLTKNRGGNDGVSLDTGFRAIYFVLPTSAETNWNERETLDEWKWKGEKSRS